MVHFLEIVLKQWIPMSANKMGQSVLVIKAEGKSLSQ
jgi:hypothetical protein